MISNYEQLVLQFVSAKTQLNGLAIRTNSKHTLSKHRVLVVDDDTTSNSTQFLLLSKIGFTKIDIVNTGIHAIERASRFNYDLILIEILLSDMNGFKVCNKIRKVNKNKYTPIIATTKYIKDEIMSVCYAYSICEVITKPFFFNEYKKTLLTHLKSTQKLRRV